MHKEVETAYANYIDSLLDLGIVRENYQSKLESFEQFVKKTKLKLLKDAREFHTHFCHGYQLLLQQLQYDKPLRSRKAIKKCIHCDLIVH